MNFQIASNSAGETIEIGRKIGSQLKGGEVIALVGPLGSGKTHLIKGIESMSILVVRLRSPQADLIYFTLTHTE